MRIMQIMNTPIWPQKYLDNQARIDDLCQVWSPYSEFGSCFAFLPLAFVRSKARVRKRRTTGVRTGTTQAKVLPFSGVPNLRAVYNKPKRTSERYVLYEYGRLETQTSYYTYDLIITARRPWWLGRFILVPTKINLVSSILTECTYS